MENKQTSLLKEKVTNQIIEILNSEKALDWVKTWNAGTYKNLCSKKSYNGVNKALLCWHKLTNKFNSNNYLTFNQIRGMKGSLKKGSKGCPVVYWNILRYPVTVCKTCGETSGSCKCKVPEWIETEHARAFLKNYTVFNVEQTDLQDLPESTKIIYNISNCEAFITNIADKPEINFGGDVACYCPSTDKISMPEMKTFQDSQSFYSTIFHELIHSTGHKNRLNRDGITESDFFGGETYSKEEIVAELGASLVNASLGIDGVTIKNSTAYIKSWLDKLKADKSFIFEVSSKSEKAYSFLANGGKK